MALSTILITALATTVGTAMVAFISHHLTSARDDRENDRRASYAAIRVVCVLDEFVRGCSEAAADRGEPDADGHRCPGVEDPKLLYPEDVDWKSLQPKMMYQALALPNRLSAAHRTIMDVANYMAGPPDYEEVFEQRALEFGYLGFLAADLAEAFRQHYSILPLCENEYYRSTLDDAIDGAKSARQERKKRSVAYWANVDEKRASTAAETSVPPAI